VRAQGDPLTFAIGDRVRYRPGSGTYGYDDGLGGDGRLGGRVIGLTPKRVRVELVMERGTRKGRRLTLSVDAASLARVEASQ